MTISLGFLGTGATLEERCAAHSTRGGLNELAQERAMSAGGRDALTTGLAAVLSRIDGQRPKTA